MSKKKVEPPPAAEAAAIQSPPPEQVYASELALLAAWDEGPRPPRWKLTPRAVVTFIIGSRGEPVRARGASQVITEKFVGDRALVERCVVTLAGERGLLLVGEPGTAKSMLSELLAAAISGDSTCTVQGSAGTTGD
ncbi:MAG: AAA family ATPase, partial [Kofleriaceae bacterium]